MSPTNWKTLIPQRHHVRSQLILCQFATALATLGKGGTLAPLHVSIVPRFSQICIADGCGESLACCVLAYCSIVPPPPTYSVVPTVERVRWMLDHRARKNTLNCIYALIWQASSCAKCLTHFSRSPFIFSTFLKWGTRYESTDTTNVSFMPENTHTFTPLLNHSFRKFCLCKPNQSRPANSERSVL